MSVHGIRVPDQLWQDALRRSEESGQNLSELIRQFLRGYAYRTIIQASASYEEKPWFTTHGPVPEFLCAMCNTYVPLSGMPEPQARDHHESLCHTQEAH